MNINRASAMEMVNHLTALDLIERRQGRNRRSNALWITDKGNDIYSKFLKMTNEVDDVLCSKLTSEESIVLFNLLSKVKQALEEKFSIECDISK